MVGSKGDGYNNAVAETINGLCKATISNGAFPGLPVSPLKDMNQDQLLARIAGSLSKAKSLEELTRPLLQLLEEVSGLESTYLTQIDLVKGVQHVQFARNSGRLAIPEGLQVDWEDTLCRRALDADLRYVDDVPKRWADSTAARQLGIVTYASVPVRTSDGQIYGTLCAASAKGRPPSEQATAVFEMLSLLIAQFVERDRLVHDLRQLNEQLSSMALTDWLTGISNRRALSNDLSRLLAQARRARQSVLICFIDLDRFKAINDQYGHDVGDQFLKAMANRLQMALRAGDLLARLGGDEFIVAGEGPPLGDRVDDAAEAMRARIAEVSMGRFALGDVVLEYPGASVGAVSLDPILHDVDSALREADLAMYEVKQARQGVR
jgi:diguanylate cyclase